MKTYLVYVKATVRVKAEDDVDAIDRVMQMNFDGDDLEVDHVDSVEPADKKPKVFKLKSRRCDCVGHEHLGGKGGCYMNSGRPDIKTNGPSPCKCRVNLE